jgi:hypothetical protein
MRSSNSECGGESHFTVEFEMKDFDPEVQLRGNREVEGECRSLLRGIAEVEVSLLLSREERSWNQIHQATGPEISGRGR